MSTPRKSDLTHLEAKLDEFGRALAEVREMIANRVTAAEAGLHQVKGQITGLTLKADAHDKRLSLLEAAKERAEGAAAGAGKLGKLVWTAILAAWGVFEWFSHRGGK